MPLFTEDLPLGPTSDCSTTVKLIMITLFLNLTMVVWQSGSVKSVMMYIDYMFQVV